MLHVNGMEKGFIEPFSTRLIGDEKAGGWIEKKQTKLKQ